MQYPIILKSKSSNYYEAEPLGIPELRFIGNSETDAFQKITLALKEWFTSSKIVQVNIPEVQESNPWLKACGRSSDDPDFEDFIKEIRNMRSENTKL
ncbi:hypothetical protein MHK_002156 [Candidatus Magnetomorum sp. HK-1]|nr:hypothetical protein MHK_002156 [Candidatus Magnetomorum sp. HK-1]